MCDKAFEYHSFIYPFFFFFFGQASNEKYIADTWYTKHLTESYFLIFLEFYHAGLPFLDRPPHKRNSNDR